MKNIKEHLEQWFSSMICKYPWIKFEYEISENGAKHRICVYPKDIADENERYCEDEIAFSMSLDRDFPNVSILFSTEHELFSCSAAAEVYEMGMAQLATTQNLKYNFENYPCSDITESFHDYALAA